VSGRICCCNNGRNWSSLGGPECVFGETGEGKEDGRWKNGTMEEGAAGNGAMVVKLRFKLVIIPWTEWRIYRSLCGGNALDVAFVRCTGR
jgi:hypothetical protein